MRKKKGFTILEIMIVVAIIGLLTAIAAPGFKKVRDNVRKDSCYNNMRVIAHAVQQYSLDNNLPVNIPVSIYDDYIMPSNRERNPELYIPRHLVCPAGKIDYNKWIDSGSLNVTCQSPESHGSYNDI